MQVLEESLYSELSSDRLILSNSQWIYISRSVKIHTTDGSENRQQLPKCRRDEDAFTCRGRELVYTPK